MGSAKPSLRALALALALATAGPAAGCFRLWPTCDVDCSGVVLSANATHTEAICTTDDRCLECANDLDCRTACSPSWTCAPCSADTPCRSSTDACVDGVCRACVDDAECGVGRVCSSGECGAACATTEDCAPHFSAYLSAATSTTRRTGWFGCRFHDNWADAGLLRLVCSGDGYGENAIVCDPCLASLAGGAACDRCTTSGDCACVAHEDCPGGFVCRSAICGPCTHHDECGDGYCEKGRCTSFCGTDEDCPLGRCDPVSGHCRECLETADCPVGTRCYFDGCVAPCASDADCVGCGCSEIGRCGACSIEP